MRFFSNEAKENADDVQDTDNEKDRERADSEGLPTPVPQQRVGSPWSDAPGSDTAEAEPVEPQAHDDRAEASTDLRDESLRRDDSEVRHDGDDLVRDEGTTRHDDELDLPLDDRDRAGSHRADAVAGDTADRTDDAADRVDPADRASDGDRVSESDRLSEGDRLSDGDRLSEGDRLSDGDRRSDGDRLSDGDRADDVDRADADRAGTDRVDDAPGAEQRGGTTTTYGPDGSMTTVDDADAAASENAATETASSETDGERRDLDEAAPVVATAPVETAPVDGVSAEDGTAPADRTDSADRTTVGTTDGGPVPESESTADAAAAPAVPVGAADAAAAAKPDPSASPVSDKLFTDGDSYTERLRDIALNFVDNPKEATQQAGALVDEAIDKVTSALKSQKDALAGEGDDTERLRVELRGYRDILKRISSL